MADQTGRVLRRWGLHRGEGSAPGYRFGQRGVMLEQGEEERRERVGLAWGGVGHRR